MRRLAFDYVHRQGQRGAKSIGAGSIGAGGPTVRRYGPGL
ncbi:MAG: hypothetical protein OJF60_000402 [Burkholderiaceae bacterium]|nr:MAG: hypothetical protein OJF60_000402 [Burkholderiaceae bacterium]